MAKVTWDEILAEAKRAREEAKRDQLARPRTPKARRRADPEADALRSFWQQMKRPACRVCGEAPDAHPKPDHAWDTPPVGTATKRRS